MGFIEDQRRQREREMQAERQKELQRQEEQRQRNRQAELRDLENAKMERLRGEAERRFRLSGTGLLVDELIKTVRYNRKETPRVIGPHVVNLSMDNFWFDLPHGRDVYVCRIVKRMIHEGMYVDTSGKRLTVEFIQIETTPDGTINFRGGILGSTTIKQAVWEKDRDTLERALGKAYEHPKILQRRNPFRDGSNFGEGGQPGRGF